MMENAIQEAPAALHDDEAAKVTELFNLWKRGRSKSRCSKFRPVGLLTSGRFVFLHLERKKRGVSIPKLVAQAELHIVKFRDQVNRAVIHSARNAAYEKLRTM